LNRPGQVYSIKQGGLVVAHTESIKLHDCQLVVNQSGNKRVRREKRKNVHAFIIGHIVRGFLESWATNNQKHKNLNQKITYNPYTDTSFMLDEEPINETQYVFIGYGGVWTKLSTTPTLKG